MTKQKELYELIESKNNILSRFFNLIKFKNFLKHKMINPALNYNWATRSACYNGKMDFVKLLLKDNRVDPSDNKNEAFLLAIKSGHIDIVTLLLNDPRINPCDCQHSAIVEAFQNRHINILNILWKDKRLKNALKNEDEELYKKLINDDVQNKVSDF